MPVGLTNATLDIGSSTVGRERSVKAGLTLGASMNRQKSAEVGSGRIGICGEPVAQQLQARVGGRCGLGAFEQAHRPCAETSAECLDAR